MSDKDQAAQNDLRRTLKNPAYLLVIFIVALSFVEQTRIRDE